MPTGPSPPRVLVSRTDRIGDVVLTLPLCGLLKRELGAAVAFLGSRYTRPVLEASEAVDEIHEWDDAVHGRDPAAARALLAAARADVVLHAFPRAPVARAARAAGVPRRVGTSRRWYHWLTCTDLVPLARRNSPWHEAQLNLQLARALLPRVDQSTAELAPYGRLAPRSPLPADVEPLLAPGRFALVLHPKSLGSAREWPLASYRALVDALDPGRFRVLVTGSAAEGEAMRDWLAALPAHAHDLCGRLTLAELTSLLARAGGMVAASTGPLHVAAAAGTHTLGLFSPVRPVHPERWAPIGPRAEWLAAPAACDACGGGQNGRAAACACMAAISVTAVLARVEAWACAEGRGPGLNAARGAPASVA